MNLIPVNVTSIQIGKPLPFPLMDKSGVLLAKKSFVIESEKELREFANRNGGLFIDGSDANDVQRAYRRQLDTMVRTDQSLGSIAETKISASPRLQGTPTAIARIDWLDLQEQANALLRDSNRAVFMERLEAVHHTVGQQLERNADEVLFALIHLSASETQRYSATHSLLVSALCGLASRNVLKWPQAHEDVLRKAALTMNLGMTELQNKLALQTEPPTSEQRLSIQEHAEKSVAILQACGVCDITWLEVVYQHHRASDVPLASQTLVQRLSGLLQRADMFAARLAPRASRVPSPTTVAMQACYFDAQGQIDELGAALIKVAGIYQPGSFVRLASQELAVVVKRGLNTSSPKVAVLLNRDGMALAEPTLRDTSAKEYRVIASVPHRQVRVKVNLPRMLLLTAPSA